MGRCLMADMLVIAAVCRAAACDADETEAVVASRVELPSPRSTTDMLVEKALHQRRSVREFDGTPLTLAEVSQLLWAAQGTTRGGAGRTAPSAGALYPLEVFVVAGNVTGLASGVYRYVPGEHALATVVVGDRRKQLAAAALGQDWMTRAPVLLLIAGVDERTAAKYGRRATRYVDFEAGCAAQNVALEAVALALGTVVIGAFEDARVQSVAGLAVEERPIALMPVGRE